MAADFSNLPAFRAILKRYEELSNEANKELIWLLSIEKATTPIGVETLPALIGAIELHGKTVDILYSEKHPNKELYIIWNHSKEEVIVENHWASLSEEEISFWEMEQYSYTFREWLESLSSKRSEFREWLEKNS